MSYKEQQMHNQAGIRLEEAEGTVSRIDHGFKTWSNLSLKNRMNMVSGLRKIVSKNARKIAGAIAEECGRPRVEALSQEVLPVLEMAKYCEKKFPEWLSWKCLPYRRPGFWRKRNDLCFEPIGPVAIFSPRNFPFSLGMMTLIYTLLPGNTAVLKPSEKSRLIPSLIAEFLEEAGLTASEAASVLIGDARTGQRLIQHPAIKKIFFFGNRKSGEAVADLCRKHSKPSVLESGGGSTAFVCADADIVQAATGLAWSSFYTHGQSCVSTERIFVDEKVAGKFIPLFKQKINTFQGEMVRKGPCLSLDELRLNGMIEDAKERGAGIFQAGVDPSGGKHGFFRFTMISGFTESMRVSKEEIFGPVVAVRAVPDFEEAISELKSTHLSMGVSIWSGNQNQAYNLAKKIPAGMIWINDSSFGLPHLPWGGSGEQGRGMLFSEHAVQEVARLKWISRHPGRFFRPRFWWNPYSSWKERLMTLLAEHFF